MSAPSENGPRRIGIAELEQRLGIDRSTIWRWYRAGKFPEPEYLTDRRTWRLEVVEAWEQERLARPASDRRGARNLEGGAASHQEPQS